MPSLRPTWLISLLTLAGCAGSAYQGPPSDHFDGERFRNIQPTAHKSLRDLLKWQWNRPPQRPWVALPPTATPPRVNERARGEELRVTYINHATLLIQHRGLNILTDPVWSQRVSPLAFIGPKRHHPPGLTLDQLPPIDLVLVSHNHYDHLDLETLRQLHRRWPTAKVVSGLGNAGLIRQTGFADVVEIDWWQAVPLGAGLTLHGVPVQHWSSRTRSDTNRTLWLGFVIDSPDGPLLFPGDTGLGPEFGLIHQRFGAMRFAALPIGAYEPRWFMRDHHMNPDDAVQAHRTLQAQTSMAIHFGTFNLTDEQQDDPPKALQAALRSQGVDPATFGTPKPGEQWRVAPRNVAQEAEPTRREQQLR
ncbi:MBL fold metallo-hydrolase [Pseudomonas aeruginosa]|uniref:MBL fold metallo-hydrolase n=1 Tax=Pseudomonas aeruginosa TaxID=287 RepID=UPI00106CAB94|nr:MBL fold metallo-hydrolase [Pseudomonas aeruginosa]